MLPLMLAATAGILEEHNYSVPFNLALALKRKAGCSRYTTYTV